jgi:type II secretory pathway component PulF
MVSVFSLFVLPSLQSFYVETGHVLPEFSQQVMRWAPLLAVGVSLLAVYVLASAQALRGLLPSAGSSVSVGRLAWLLPSALRAQGARVRALVASPALAVDDLALKHELAAMEAEGLLLSEELPGILRLQSQGLQRLADSFSVGLLLLLSLAVVASIATFLVAIYLPIFRMGSTL